MLNCGYPEHHDKMQAQARRCRTLAVGLSNRADIAMLESFAVECDAAAAHCVSCRARGVVIVCCAEPLAA